MHSILGREIHIPPVDSVSGAATESVSIGLPLCRLRLSIVTLHRDRIAHLDRNRVRWYWSIWMRTLGKGISAARSSTGAGLWCFGVYRFYLNKTRFDCLFLNCFFLPRYDTVESITLKDDRLAKDRNEHKGQDRCLSSQKGREACRHW